MDNSFVERDWRRAVPLQWPRASRRKLHGVRTPHKADPADVSLSAPQAWTALQKMYSASLEAGITYTADPACADLLARVQASLVAWTALESSRDDLPRPALSGVTDPVLALQLVERFHFPSSGEEGFDLVESLGAAAAPVLETLIAKTRPAYRARGFKSALKVARAGEPSGSAGAIYYIIRNILR